MSHYRPSTNTVREALRAAERRVRELYEGAPHNYKNRDAALRDAHMRVRRLEEALQKREVARETRH